MRSRAVALALALGICLLPASAAASGKHAALVVDANTGDVLHADAADEPRYPASLTKMMTIYLVLEAVERGRVSLDARIRISQEAASAAPSKLDLDPGETIALGDAVKALITKSANDIAVAVAEHLGGSERQFAQMMTEKARLLGMSRTVFRNASGLPDLEQVTTARDMVTLGLRLADDFPRHFHLFGLRSFSHGGSSYRSHNSLLFNFQGTDGIKTGYTRASGFNIVTSVRRGSRHVIGAVFGGASAARRDDAMRLLMSRSLVKASPARTRKPAPVLVASARPASRPATAAGPASAQAKPTEQTSAPALVAAPTEARRRSTSGESAGTTVASSIAATASPSPAQTTHAAVAPLPASNPLETPAPYKIEIARVRPVMVPQRPRLEPPRSEPLGEALGQPSAMPTSAPNGVVSPTTAAEQARPAAALQRAATPTAIQRGMPPSTLQAQAESLARAGAPAPAAPAPVALAQAATTPQFRLSGPTSAASASTAFEIQIGAFGTAAEAERALAAARGSTGALLQAASPRAIPIQKEGRQLFRARFAGFNSKTAADTCLELRRRQIDCFVMRAE